MYRVQVWSGGRWCWGVRDYTQPQAENRAKALNKMGIKARIRPLSELLN